MSSFSKKILATGSASVFAFLLLAQIGMTWTGPTVAPTGGNISAPINAGSTAQTKSGVLGVNGLAVFGNALISTSNYLNWGTTAGDSGYGIRDNAGTMQYKNSADSSWSNFGSGGSSTLWVPVSTTGMYAADNRSVGINTTNPGAKLEVYESATSYLRANEAGVALLNLQSSFASAPILKIDGTGAADLIRVTDSGSAVLYVKDGGNVGIGTASPSARLDVRNSGYSVVTPVGASSADAWTSGGVNVMRARGTLGSASHPLSGDRIGFFSGSNAVSPVSWAGMDIYATQNHTASAQGMQLNFNTVANGGTGGITRLVIGQDGVSTFSGNVIAPAFLYSSDARLKERIAALKDGLAKVLALSPVSFTWNSGPNKGEDDIGFIAQDVEKVVPGIVQTGENGTKAVDYVRLVPILVSAMQEQQKEIESLKADIAELKAAR